MRILAHLTISAFNGMQRQFGNSIKDDPRYCCHGRAVSLSEGFEENIQLQASLALLQGVGICD